MRIAPSGVVMSAISGSVAATAATVPSWLSVAFPPPAARITAGTQIASIPATTATFTPITSLLRKMPRITRSARQTTPAPVSTPPITFAANPFGAGRTISDDEQS